ncbi:BlaR1 peptidase M56 [Chryseobacterium arachidis]|uniref:BlaR1 peptidase M56 n=1 Tax=Chryseobacterium arachidis TaxID=1416778 RepID=A0A1M5LCT1_9FLAO|nr:M56 family metallopeptidase [Chryseobacterium arachidis]SHG62827.1 BlaR1 peptidase M56 [Chryseobacterium arachidis]
MIILLKIIICSGLLLGLYYLFLSKEKTFTFNRIYLLLGLIFSYTVPFITIEKEAEAVEPALIFETIKQQPTTAVLIPAEKTFNHENVLLIIYVAVAVFFLIKFIHSIFKLKKLKGEEIVYNHKTVVLLNQEMAPFSFMNKIYFSKNYLENDKIDEKMFLHEKIHVDQKHSLDIFLVEILKIMTWFNPFVYFYKQAIITNHEFLADEAVIKKGNDIKSYQNLILSEILKQQKLNLTHQFNFDNTKKRFIMMTAKNSKFAAIKKYLALPVFGSLTLLFAEKVYANGTAETENPISEIFTPSPVSHKNQPEALKEFLGITEKYTDIIENKDFERFKTEVPRSEQVRLVELFDKIDIKNQLHLPIWIHYDEILKQVPTQKQLDQFLNPQYNITLNGNIVDNSILNNYKNTDFYHVYVLKILPKNPDYGKFDYAVTLYTTEYALKFNREKNIALSFKATDDKEYKNHLEALKALPVKESNENKKITDTIRPKEGKNTNLTPTKEQNTSEAPLNAKADEQTPAEFPGGIDKLRNEFMLAFDSKFAKGSKGVLKANINILIDEKGNLKMFNVSGSDETMNSEVSKSIFAVLQNKKWKPATKDGIPVESNFRFPIVLSLQ